MTTPQPFRQPPDIAALLKTSPYIQKFHGKPVVIKYGGSAMTDEALREGFAQEVAALKQVGIHPIVVHGGGSEITSFMERLGIGSSFADGLRITNAEAVPIVKMVLVGKINKEIVERINRHGQSALGLCGDDGRLFQVSKRPSGAHDLGFVGRIDQVDTDLLLKIARDYVTVIAPVGSDAAGQSYNINADEATGSIAQALTASKAVFLTDVPGWLSDPEDPDSLIHRTTVAEVETALRKGEVSGGMLPKLQACVDAIKGGAESAHIIDGLMPNSLLVELLTDHGIGTKVFP